MRRQKKPVEADSPFKQIAMLRSAGLRSLPGVQQLLCGLRGGAVIHGEPAHVRVAPQPGSLRRIDCTMPHPRGRVSVALRFDGAAVEGRVTLPDGVDGEFVWRGRSVALHGGENAVNFGNVAVFRLAP